MYHSTWQNNIAYNYMYMHEANDIHTADVEIYEIYFKQLRSRKERLLFINDLFNSGSEVAIDNYVNQYIPEVSVKIIYSAESLHPIYGPAYLCIDAKNIMHISTNKLILVKHILGSFNMAGYIITKIPKPLVQIRHPECKFYRSYKLHNSINNTIPISLS